MSAQVRGELMRAASLIAVPVQRRSELVGMLTLEHLGAWIIENCALRKCRPRSTIEDIVSKV